MSGNNMALVWCEISEEERLRLTEAKRRREQRVALKAQLRLVQDRRRGRQVRARRERTRTKEPVTSCLHAGPPSPAAIQQSERSGTIRLMTRYAIRNMGALRQASSMPMMPGARGPSAHRLHPQPVEEEPP